MYKKIINNLDAYSNKFLVMTEEDLKLYLDKLLINVVADLPPNTSEHELLTNFKMDLQDLFEIIDKRIVVLYNNKTYDIFYHGMDISERLSSYIYNRIKLLKTYNEFINALKINDKGE